MGPGELLLQFASTLPPQTVHISASFGWGPVHDARQGWCSESGSGSAHLQIVMLSIVTWLCRMYRDETPSMTTHQAVAWTRVTLLRGSWR